MSQPKKGRSRARARGPRAIEAALARAETSSHRFLLDPRVMGVLRAWPIPEALSAPPGFVDAVSAVAREVAGIGIGPVIEADLTLEVGQLSLFAYRTVASANHGESGTCPPGELLLEEARRLDPDAVPGDEYGVLIEGARFDLKMLADYARALQSG